MKVSDVGVVLLMLLFASDPVTAARKAYCHSDSDSTGFRNCAACGPGSGYADNDNTISGIPVLHTCGGKNLDRLQCAHQCRCYQGVLQCREWNTCRASTVTEHCSCVFNDDTNSCEPNTFNEKTDSGGVCFCPDRDTSGSPPDPCPSTQQAQFCLGF